MSLLKLDLLFIFAIFLLAIFAPEAKAFTCVNLAGTAVNSNVRLSVLNSVSPCAAGQFAILAPAEVTAYSNAVTTVAAHTTQIAALQGTTTTQGTTITTQASTITGLQGTTTTQGTTITTLQNQVTTYQSQITALQNSVTALNAAVVSLQGGSGGGGTASPPFDGVLAAAYWSFAMSFIVGAWLISKKAGLILSFIRGRRR
jgi:uncharacterized coiled-coil protein SlyX